MCLCLTYMWKWKAPHLSRYAKNALAFLCVLSTPAPPSLAHVAALRRPEAAASASDLAGAVELLIALRDAFLLQTTTAAADDEEEGNDEEQRRVGHLLVGADARAR